uniref:CST complex subunit Ten1 n=1 Tax=Bionectria ochroleuca TaxID=29856 RepID=A0A0B7K8E7_BIOOC
MSRGPLPSQLCLLSQLPAYAVHDKVRFLGWLMIWWCSVLAYSTRGAILQLAHAYPRGTNVTAHVDVSLVLETLGEEQTRVGEWVNVIGYITAKADTASAPTAPSTATQAASVHIQALVLWSTGPLNVDRYEMSFEKKTNKE